MLSVVWLVFAAVMVAAAVIDLISYRIPNTLVGVLLVLFSIVAVANWNEVTWLTWLGHLGAGILIFGAGILLYATRQMGAGDVKLLGVVALWAGAIPPIQGWPSPIVVLLFYVSLCGLLGMLVILALRLIVPRLQPKGGSAQRALARVLTRGQGIPYAIGIGPGAIIASFSFAPWLWKI